MAGEGNGPSGGEATRSDGGPGPATDDTTSGDKTPSDGTDDEGALGQGKRSRRPRQDDRLGGLFADIKDADLHLVYVEPDHDYERACEVLRDRRVVVLQGEPGSGRHAMARYLLLHGLRPRGADDGVGMERIERIPSTTELAKLKPLQRRSGHILERWSSERADRLRADELRSAAEILAKWEGYLVVTVDDAVTVLAGEPATRSGWWRVAAYPTSGGCWSDISSSTLADTAACSRGTVHGWTVTTSAPTWPGTPRSPRRSAWPATWQVGWPGIGHRTARNG
jgi:hypothetical protein